MIEAIKERISALGCVAAKSFSVTLRVKSVESAIAK
jgi:hypothetical protein